MSDQPRIVLVLGKYRVINRALGKIKLALGGTTTMEVAVESFMDVKEGDLLTLYTEVFLNPPAGVN